MHRIHESYGIRHHVFRFLATELGFIGFVMESGFPDSIPVDEWVQGGPGGAR